MKLRQIKEKNLYREIFRGAFEIAWHRRELWLLGLLASFLLMNGGAFEFIVRAVAKISGGAPYSGAIGYGQAIFAGLTGTDTVTQTSIFFTLVLFLAVFVLVIVLAVASSGGLLLAAARLAERKKADLRGLFAAGLEKIGPLLATQAIGRALIFAAFVIAALGVYVPASRWSGALAAIALFVVFAAVALIVSFLMMMTNAGIMIGKEKWMDAACDAGRFLKKHWLISLEMIGLLFLLALSFAAAIVIGMLVILVPFTLILLAVSALHLPALIIAMSYLLQFVLLAAIITAGSMLSAFEHAAWGLLYARLADRGAVAKLERIWRGIKNLRMHARSKR